MAYLKNISKIFSLLMITFLFSACGTAVDETPQAETTQEVSQTPVEEQDTPSVEEIVTNTEPEAQIVDKLTRENGIDINFSAEVYDAEDDQLTFKWQEGDTILSTEKVFTKNDFSEGEHNITFTVTDAHGASTSEIMTITILPSNDINDIPTTQDQNIVTNEDEEVSFTLDTNDVEGQTLSMTIISEPLHGNLSGTFPNLTYTPNKNFRGSDTVTYKVNDGNADSNEATVYILIRNVNDMPTVNAGKDQTIRVGHTTWVSGTATDTDGNIETYVWKEQDVILSTQPSFQYTPSTVGNHLLTLSVTDNENTTATDTLTVNATNKVPLLIIRVEFDDKVFHSDATTWSNKIFSNAEGDLNDYFNEISYGRLQFEKAQESHGIHNDGIITIHLSIDHPGNENNLVDKLIEITEKADAYINFSQYDQNKNGTISVDELQVSFLVAGGENATGAYPGIWAHASCLAIQNAGKEPIFDNTKVMACSTYGTYSMFGERHKYGNNEHDATIGIIAHELSHTTLSLIDLYDVEQNADSEGIGNFGLMGSGNWGRKSYNEKLGATPSHMTGWSKIQAKFIKPTLITENSSIEFIGTSDQDYKLYKVATQNENEYFLLENRANQGYDRGLFLLQDGNNFTGGLSITHIDESVEDNNDQNHKKVDIEEANNAGLDNNTTHRGHINNLYFSGNADSFTPSTTPNSNLYDGSTSGLSITNISDTGTSMSADIAIK